MSDIPSFARDVIESASLLVPGLASELRYVTGLSRESADLWLCGDDVADICISMSDGFPAVGILVDEYIFDQVPRSNVEQLISAVYGDAAVTQIKKASGLRSVILKVQVGASILEASRVFNGELEPWEERICEGSR